MEICGDPACSEGEAGIEYVLDEEAAGHGPEAGEQLAVIHDRANSENAASAQPMGKIDPQEPGWTKRVSR